MNEKRKKEVEKFALSEISSIVFLLSLQFVGIGSEGKEDGRRERGRLSTCAIFFMKTDHFCCCGGF